MMKRQIAKKSIGQEAKWPYQIPPLNGDARNLVNASDLRAALDSCSNGVPKNGPDNGVLLNGVSPQEDVLESSYQGQAGSVVGNHNGITQVKKDFTEEPISGKRPNDEPDGDTERKKICLTSKSEEISNKAQMTVPQSLDTKMTPGPPVLISDSSSRVVINNNGLDNETIDLTADDDDEDEYFNASSGSTPEFLSTNKIYGTSDAIKTDETVLPGMNKDTSSVASEHKAVVSSTQLNMLHHTATNNNSGDDTIDLASESSVAGEERCDSPFSVGSVSRPETPTIDSLRPIQKNNVKQDTTEVTTTEDSKEGNENAAPARDKALVQRLDHISNASTEKPKAVPSSAIATPENNEHGHSGKAPVAPVIPASVATVEDMEVTDASSKPVKQESAVSTGPDRLASLITNLSSKIEDSKPPTPKPAETEVPVIQDLTPEHVQKIMERVLTLPKAPVVKQMKMHSDAIKLEKRKVEQILAEVRLMREKVRQVTARPPQRTVSTQITAVKLPSVENPIANSAIDKVLKSTVLSQRVFNQNQRVANGNNSTLSKTSGQLEKSNPSSNNSATARKSLPNSASTASPAQKANLAQASLQTIAPKPNAATGKGAASVNIKPGLGAIPVNVKPSQSAIPANTKRVAMLMTKESDVIDLTSDDDNAPAKSKSPISAPSTAALPPVNKNVSSNVVPAQHAMKTPVTANQPSRPAPDAQSPQHILVAQQPARTYGTQARPNNIVPKSNVPARPPVKHPVPLPPNDSISVPTATLAVPPAPILHIAIKKEGIVLQWNMTLNRNHASVSNYQIFGYKERPDRCSMSEWKKVGDLKALPLPMACTLTQFQPGHRYHFAVRAQDRFRRTGEFSLPKHGEI